MFSANSSYVTCVICTDTLGYVHLGGEGWMVTGVFIGRRLVCTLFVTLGDGIVWGGVGVVRICTWGSVRVWSLLGTLGSGIRWGVLGGDGICTLGAGLARCYTVARMVVKICSRWIPMGGNNFDCSYSLLEYRWCIMLKRSYWYFCCFGFSGMVKDIIKVPKGRIGFGSDWGKKWGWGRVL